VFCREREGGEWLHHYLHDYLGQGRCRRDLGVNVETFQKVFYRLEQIYESAYVVTNALECLTCGLRYLDVIMSQGRERRHEKEAHTVSRIPRPICIARAGGNDCEIGVRDVEYSIGGLGHTVIVWPRAGVATTFERVDTILLSEFMILSLPRVLLKAGTCS
jgi:hypothetical protein